MSPVPPVTVRARFTKLGKVRFLSHRDLARAWERALRKTELPVVYTEGFSPRPKVHFGLALSTGHESLGEYLDIDLDPASAAAADVVAASGTAGGACVLDRYASLLSAALPEGVDCTALARTDRQGPSLQEAVTSCTWSIVLGGGTAPEAAAAVDAVLAAQSLVITRERKGRPVTEDIRAHVRDLQLDPRPVPTEWDGGVAILAELATQPRTVRPAELIGALGPQWGERRVCRLHQWINHAGVPEEPLAVAPGPPVWARTPVRAS